jgi:hypothetical protein
LVDDDATDDVVHDDDTGESSPAPHDVEDGRNAARR